MRDFFIGTFLTIIVSCFFFPFSFTFLPAGINTKMVLAAFGIGAYVWDSRQKQSFLLHRNVFISGILAIIFSAWCFFSVTVNGSDQHEYDTYIVSFITWLAGAYGTCFIIRSLLGKADLSVITKYLTIVCVAQCIISLMIDNIPFVESLVKSVFAQSYNYYETIGRLYGIGFALDPAGIRMAAVLVLIAHQITRQAREGNSSYVTSLFLGFIIISVIGSMVARTTLVGLALGLGFIIATNGGVNKGGFISLRQIRLFAILLILLGIAIFVSAYLYNTNDVFHNNFRFAFEGFFNWMETGVWSTTSTDILEDMWIWPESGDTRTWWIGAGIVGIYKINSDIGYCNYIFYCGIIGLAIFSLFFIYNHLSLNRKFRSFFLTSILLCAITFIVWSKVQTDIFCIDALLFCLDSDYFDSESDIQEERTPENITT